MVSVWEQRKLKDVIIDAYQGINTTADKVIYSNEGIPVLQAKHITAGSIDFTDVRYLKKEQYNEYFPKYTPQKGDMLFANIGTIGPSTIVENQGEFLIAWNILRIVFNKNLVDAYFVHLIFDKYKDSGYFERMQTGNATKFINKDNIFDINLFMPSEVEQHKIGGYFQKLDHLITLHQRKRLGLLKVGKNAWEQRKLGDLADRVTRKNQDLVSELPLTISAQYGLINQNEFFDKRVASKDVRGYYLIRKGEFAYNKSTSTDAPWGAVKRLESYENGVLSTLYIVFGIKEGAPIDSNFLVWYYNTNLWHKDIHEIAAEGARNHGLLNIAPADFFNTKLKIPQDIEEQEGIGKYFSTLDHLITLHQQK